MGPTGKGRAILVACASHAWLVHAPAHADDGARQYAEVRLPSVAIGKTYSTWRLAQAPLVVHNVTGDTVTIHLEVVVPARHEVCPGALPLPDRSWILVETNDFTVAPYDERRIDVRLSLPYEPDLAGHTYQVDLTRSDRDRAGMRAEGARSRVLFAVEMDYRDDTEIDCAAAVDPRERR